MSSQLEPLYALPPTPFTGFLFYRFTTETCCLIDNSPARSGLLTSFVTIGTSPDVNAPLDPAAFQMVGWPFWVTLPQAPFTDFERVPTPVNAVIKVQAGKTAAIAFIYGVIAGIDTGYANISFGAMETRLSLPPDNGWPYGKIEYRFEPDWWATAVAQRRDVSG